MKIMTEEEISAIKEDLLSNKSVKRRGAAKKIGKSKIKSLEQLLLDAYIKEREDSRTWETQTEMIKALGKLDCKAAIPYLKEIVDINKDEDTITAYAALSYIRLTRNDVNDMAVILDFLENGNAMIFSGAVMAMAYDDVIPTEPEMKKVLEILNKRKSVYDRPFSNPIQRIISAMHKWPNELIMPFLNQYENMPQYTHCVENTLAGKRSCRE